MNCINAVQFYNKFVDIKSYNLRSGIFYGTQIVRFFRLYLLDAALKITDYFGKKNLL